VNERPFGAPWLVAVARAFAEAGEPLYAVGGVVRNALMNLPASDVDVCGPAEPERVACLCEGTPVRAVLRAAHFGTVELHAEDESGRHMAEYTTFREDSYRNGHRPGAVRFADTPETDALRRDFSVNALYRPLPPDPDAPATILDPTGGLEHLKRGVLHTVTADPDQVFKDDGLRILRAARFRAELGLRPTDALLASAAKYARLLGEIAYERLRDELSRLLLSDTKYPSLARTEPPVSAGLETILRIGAWPLLFGTLAPDARAIAAQAFYRAPEGVSSVSGKLALLFAHEEPALLAALMRKLRFSERDAQAAEAALAATRALLAGRCARMDAVRFGLPAVTHAEAALAALAQAGEPCEAVLLSVREMLVVLHGGKAPLNLRELAVNGNVLLTLCRKLGARETKIGATLNALWEATVAGELPNERAALTVAAERMLRESPGNEP
jgi:tRNA nucleotidyltransferase/poly(A) polymerase